MLGPEHDDKPSIAFTCRVDGTYSVPHNRDNWPTCKYVTTTPHSSKCFGSIFTFRADILEAVNQAMEFHDRELEAEVIRKALYDYGSDTGKVKRHG